MKLQKTLTLVGAMALAAALAVGGTMAYFTDKTDTVTNTFTIGSGVKITLDETKVNSSGEAVDKDGNVTTDKAKYVKTKDKEGNSYKLIPGHEYKKDPTVHVIANSESCYVFVKVENGISNLEASENTIANQIGKNWDLVQDTTDVYVYKGNYAKDNVVSSYNTDIDLPVFESFKISNLSNSDYTKLTEDIISKSIKITGYAIQSDTFTSAAEAWKASGFGDSSNASGSN
jgi:predicted ribosomally synthesized peptide with SipW-like signal peptide